MTVTVLLVDDHTVVRQGLALLLKQAAGIMVVGEAANGRVALEMAATLKPEVIVMDLAMPQSGGVDATREILAVVPEVRILVLSASDDRRHVLGALRAGAAGYIVKDCAASELVEAIHKVAQGERYVSAALRNNVIYDSIPKVHGAGHNLTPRELEILVLLAGGREMKEVATVLGLSSKTVETHRRSVMDKLNLYSVAELTKHAVRAGLTTLD